MLSGKLIQDSGAWALSRVELRTGGALASGISVPWGGHGWELGTSVCSAQLRRRLLRAAGSCGCVVFLFLLQFVQCWRANMPHPELLSGTGHCNSGCSQRKLRSCSTLRFQAVILHLRFQSH